MNGLENIGEENWDQHCIVCDKSVDHGGGMAHFKVEGEMIALCCPLCIETFNKEPKRYLSLRKLQRSGQSPLGARDHGR